MKKKETTKLLLIVFIYVISISAFTQNFNQLDEAPHDIAYLRFNKISKPLVKVVYGRPSKNGKKVFGNLVQYGELWRTGANEATEVKFYEDMLLGDTKVKAGTYVLYTIPGEKEWQIILSSNVDVLGAFQYDPVFDVAKITIPVSKAEELEAFSIAFKHRKENDAEMVLGWDSTRIRIPLKFSQNNLFAKQTTIKKGFQRG